MEHSEKFEFIKPGEVRTRFAPSPTGFLHVGSARTALFNYLFAKKHQGSFILRVEDTDIERSRSEFEKDIMDSLKWLGVEWDEFYRQSDRRDIYAKYLRKLLKEDKAYYCFCLEDELEVKRQEQMSRGLAPRYNGKCSKLSKKEIEKSLAEGKKSIIRLKVPAKKVKFTDLIRGQIEFDTSLIGDMAIAKDFSSPLYNFAVVIDDFEMKISHVIRGEDLLPNTPLQILLQEILGFPRPEYAHLPLILGPDRAKLSKRHGAVSLQEYRQQGYLPETIVNFLAFLGWNPGTEREIYSLISLIKEFSIERIQRGGAIFNIKRLDFLNGFYIRHKSPEKLTELCLPYLIEAGLIIPVWDQKELIVGVIKSPTEITGYQIVETKEKISFETLEKIILIYQERLKKLSEIAELTDFFFKEKLDYQKRLLCWKDMENLEVLNSLDKLIEVLSNIKDSDWTKENLENILIPEAEKIGLPAEVPTAVGTKAGDRGYLLWPLRVALTGKEASAGPFEIAEILGKEKTLKRLQEAKENLRS